MSKKKGKKGEPRMGKHDDIRIIESPPFAGGRADYIAERYGDYNFLSIDGHDDAVRGVVWTATRDPFLVYDRNAIVSTLMERDGMDYDMAQEFFDFNVGGAYMGEGTPGFLELIEDL